ncbi:uncharacterized protein LOC128869493 isoform X2 [Anastrepha ludens]|uniref:uncharacterized protein LOC128869493 isoform X2 n=1 Tax=Anastrepha ludens TaxID=28586 RepID=UPI0023B0A3DC|nr:uncharacterized protein LOC128869493 isoform X2 [Anastrepha ludens]
MPYFANNDIAGNADSSIQEKNYQKEFKENTVALSETTISTTQNASINHVPLRLLMNPRGKIRDITSVGDAFNTQTGLLSPDKCAELITALQTQKGKGAELFAKRRRKSEKWVVDASNTRTQSPSGLPDYHQQQVKSPTSPSILPAYSDAGKHRVQLNLHQEQVLEKYVKPGLKVVKTPWEAALETGSASSAFVEDKKQTLHHILSSAVSSEPVSQYQHVSSTVPDSASYNDGYTTDYNTAPSHKLPQARFPTCKTNFSSNTQRDLAYKPSLPQGWKSPCVTLPKELYLPKAISLESYAPPPVVNIKEPETHNSSWKPTLTSSPRSFPLSKPTIGGFLSSGFTPLAKHQYFKPDSYSMGQQEINPNVPQISYNPSPLPYEKIAKFENTSEEQAQDNDYIPQNRRLPIQNHCVKALNASPVLFGEIAGTVGRSSSPYPYNTAKSEIYDRATTTFYSKRHNINELLHGQNYNNTARGWRSRGNCDYPLASDGTHAELNGANYRGYRQKPRASADNLPYTDF